LRSLFDLDALAAFRRQQQLDPDPWRRTLHGIFKNYEPIHEAITRLPTSHQQAFREFFRPPTVHPVECVSSEIDESTKFVVASGDEARFECVLLRSGKSRAAVCVSSQVGCAAGCTFCATARMGAGRNLSTAEILEQVLFVAGESKARGKRLRNIVFMGMGEPLHNESAVFDALDFLISPLGFAIPARRINVSTVGVPDAIVRLADRFPGIQIAISLHSAIESKRRKLIPYMRSIDWPVLREQLVDVALRPRTHKHHGPLMIEHLLIDGVNDSDDDAIALREFLTDIPAMINLIPFNPIDFASQWRPSPEVRRNAFAKIMRDAGFFTTIRYSMGSDVGAACGQLVQR
jgi:23S rRNA (adenine2503-C2)-methyltransferase